LSWHQTSQIEHSLGNFGIRCSICIIGNSKANERLGPATGLDPHQTGAHWNTTFINFKPRANWNPLNLQFQFGVDAVDLRADFGAGESAVRQFPLADSHTWCAGGGYGSDPYCKEELVAELGSAFLCGYADIADRMIDKSAAYLTNWLKQLQNDRTLIVYAAAQAQKAADYILGRTFSESEVAHD
jgi:hypothetical protein